MLISRWGTRLVIAVVAIGTLVIITIGVLRPADTGLIKPSTVSAPRVGSAAPNFTLPLLQGKKVSLSDYRGQIVMLNFWRTDCTSCKAEMPALQKVYASQQTTRNSFVLLGVELSNDKTGSQQLVQAKGLTYPILLAQSSAVSDLYAISGTPTSFLLDREGIIRWKTTGPLSEESLQNALKQVSTT
jgi:cytochrome c biogenesis protein CcmG/thiol:disulfide interchange protein DsbE